MREPDTALAFCAPLHAEIARRSDAQDRLVALYLTGTGVVGGIALGGDVDRAPLLLVPMLSIAFGVLWLDHARVIEQKARAARAVERNNATLKPLSEVVED